MNEFLEGVFGMNKGVSIEEIEKVVENKVSVGCNGIVIANQKGDNYVVQAIGNKISSMPMEIIDGVVDIVDKKLDEKLDTKLAEYFRIIQTAMLESSSALCDTNKHISYEEWYDYDSIAKLPNKQSVNGTNLKYSLVDDGVMTKNDNGHFYLVSLNIDDYPDFIRNNCKIDKKENRRGKEELFFKASFVEEYIMKNIYKIKNARKNYELNKIANEAIKDISDKAREIKTNVDKYYELANVFEKDYRQIISNTIGKYGENKEKWINCYNELENKHYNGLHDEFIAYAKLYKNRTGNDASKLYFVIFEKGLAEEMMRIVFNKFPSKAAKALTKYREGLIFENEMRELLA